MGERADRDEVDAGLGVRADVRLDDAARRPRAARGRATSSTARATSSGAMLSSRIRSAPAASASRDLRRACRPRPRSAGREPERPDRRERGTDAARDAHVVVLDQDRVVETHAVVRAAAAADGVLLERTQAGRRLAGVEDRRRRCRRRDRRSGGSASRSRTGAPTRLSATRSPVSSARAGPSTSAIALGTCEISAPSSTSGRSPIAGRGSGRPPRRRAAPATTPGCSSSRRACARSPTGTIASVGEVTVPDVLGERELDHARDRVAARVESKVHGHVSTRVSLPRRWTM